MAKLKRNITTSQGFKQLLDELGLTVEASMTPKALLEQLQKLDENLTYKMTDDKLVVTVNGTTGGGSSEPDNRVTITFVIPEVFRRREDEEYLLYNPYYDTSSDYSIEEPEYIDIPTLINKLEQTNIGVKQAQTEELAPLIEGVFQDLMAMPEEERTGVLSSELGWPYDRLPNADELLEYLVAYNIGEVIDVNTAAIESLRAINTLVNEGVASIKVEPGVKNVGSLLSIDEEQGGIKVYPLLEDQFTTSGMGDIFSTDYSYIWVPSFGTSYYDESANRLDFAGYSLEEITEPITDWQRFEEDESNFVRNENINIEDNITLYYCAYALQT